MRKSTVTLNMLCLNSNSPKTWTFWFVCAVDARKLRWTYKFTKFVRAKTYKTSAMIWTDTTPWVMLWPTVRPRRHERSLKMRKNFRSFNCAEISLTLRKCIPACACNLWRKPQQAGCNVDPVRQKESSTRRGMQISLTAAKIALQVELENCMEWHVPVIPQDREQYLFWGCECM